MKIIKNLFCLLIVVFLIGCKKDNIAEQNVIERNNMSMEIYKEIEDCINNNRISLVHNTSKTLEHYGLWKDELDFKNKRLDYFIALLNNDEITINEYHILANDFFYKIPLGDREFYFYTKENLDVQLFYLLENNFNELKLPVNIISKYIGYR